MRRRETVGLDRWNAGDSPAHKASAEKTPGGQKGIGCRAVHPRRPVYAPKENERPAPNCPIL